LSEHRITVTVNGVVRTLSVPARLKLSDFLRDRLDLTATHVGCEHGRCGSCMVRVDGEPVLSCLRLAVQVDGAAVETLEGIADSDAVVTLQQAFHQQHGLQCGFCTPGVLLTASGLLERSAQPTREEIVTALGGHLCRCTGYVNILRAVEAAANGGNRDKDEHAAPPGRMLGAPLRRREDPRLLRGDGRYVADIRRHGLLHAAVVRSTVAHAVIRTIDLSAARADPRAIAVLSAADFGEELAFLPSNGPFGPGPQLPSAQPVLARDRVRYFGEPVAIVVASDRYAAEDLAALVHIEYAPLDVVRDTDQSTEDGCIAIHEDGNVHQIFQAARGDVEAGLAQAPYQMRETFTIGRQAGGPMETRGVVAEWDTVAERLTVWTSTQVPHGVKAVLCTTLGLDAESVRVILPDVGGGFGSKLQTYPEEVLVGWLARELRRPVSWIEDRIEHLTATTHGRDQTHDVEVGYDNQGNILAIRSRLVTDAGAYGLAFVNTEAMVALGAVPGPYRIPHVEVSSASVFTNKTPNSPFRGVGQAPASFVIERIIDIVAHRLGLDPAEVRLRNALGPDELPFDTGLGSVYDSGDYPGLLRQALDVAGYQQLRDDQRRLRAAGRRVGIGLALFVEGTGHGSYEVARVRINEQGHAHLASAAAPSGQGHQTILSQILADELHIPPEQITVSLGDTDEVRWGIGTLASRTAVQAGTAVRLVGVEIRERAARIAAFLLEAAVDDLVLEDGVFHVVGDISRVVSWAEVAQAVAPVVSMMPAGPPPLPEGVSERGLEATHVFETAGFPTAYGAHVSVVEVDAETGVVTLLRHLVVDDCGTVINPLLLEGQIHGGTAFGVGGALLEEIVYDEKGIPRGSTLQDYLHPGPANIARDTQVHHVHEPVLTPWNPDGIKGVGEGSTIGSTSAIANAVADAIGVEAVTMIPLTPERVRAHAAAHERVEADPIGARG